MLEIVLVVHIMAGDYVMKKLGDESMPIEFYYSRKIENEDEKYEC